MNICLNKMTRSKMHAFFREFCYDTALSGRNSQEYAYDPVAVDQYFDHHIATGRHHYAIDLNDKVIGDIYIKNISLECSSCEIGIHMMNDCYKGKGYGTTALQQMLQHIKQTTEIKEVYSQTKPDNIRCIRILEKANFQNISNHAQELIYVYKIEA